MRTAVLVLAILGDVFGGIGALAAFVFGATLVGLSGGTAGQGATNGAFLALLALAIGIGGTAVATRRPRLAGSLCLIAAVVGTLGTFAFALGSLLYIVAGVLAFFVKPELGTPDVATFAVPPALGATANAHFRSRRTPGLPRFSRRVWLPGAAVALLLTTVLTGSALAQPAEHRPIRTLLEGLQNADDVALASVLAPNLRAGNGVRDAETALILALGRSEIGFVNADWLRRLGPVTGTTMTFEHLTLTTTSKTDRAATVHIRGLFAPTNENPVLRLLLQGLRQTFDADIAVSSISGAWYVTSSAVAVPPPAPLPPSSDARPATTPPSIPRHLALGTYAAPPSASLMSQGWRMTLRDVTVNVDESVLLEIDLTVGPVDGPWAARESRLELRSGQWLGVIGDRSRFYDGGKGPGAVVRVALAFPPGLAGDQPYVIRVCGNLGFCWPPMQGLPLGER